MNQHSRSWPLDTVEHLADALREQGTPEAEIAETASALQPLADWAAPVPTPEDTRRLIAHLQPAAARAAPVASPTRLALQGWTGGVLEEAWGLLRLVRAQVGLLTPSFWLASVVIVALGVLLVWAAPNLSRSFLLYVIGPLLAYIGTASAFRASGLMMLEVELACPPSARQLTVARLSVVLSYDLALGLLLSALLWPGSGAGFWLLTLHWLAPLLLGIGLTLLLSLRAPIARAAAITYTGWLALLMLALIDGNGVQSAVSAIPPGAELGLGLAGVALMGLALLALPRAVPGLLPRRGH